MIEPKIKDYELDFTALTDRQYSDMIVIHHTGNSDSQGNYIDDDLSAAGSACVVRSYTRRI